MGLDFLLADVSELEWFILNLIGTIAFAISGALVAIDEDFDVLGTYVLGFSTAFFGGLTRNITMGIPVQLVWQQTGLFIAAFITITVVLALPVSVWKEGVPYKVFNFTDAIGLAAFAVQGANWGMQIGTTFAGVVVSTALTATGGGMWRDVFANRKPMIFRDEIYALWTLIAAITIYFVYPANRLITYGIHIIIIVLRMLTVKYTWQLPKHSGIKLERGGDRPIK